MPREQETEVAAQEPWDNLMRSFGYDCPACDDPGGMLGTVSCRVCGFIPEEVRA